LSKHSKEDSRRSREALLAVLPQVSRFARSLTGNRHDADDLLQATVERVLERGMPNDVDALRWTFKVCKNLWIDDRRAHAVRLKTAALPELAEEPSVSGETTATAELTLREVDRAMATLPDEQRAVLALVAVEGLSYREAADALEIPIGTVMSRLARARAALAERFDTDRASEARSTRGERR
jgi:RNA polymerase sigma-70 factor (ECF subfamily)